MTSDDVLVVAILVLLAVMGGALLLGIVAAIIRVWRWLFYPRWWRRGYKMVKREWSLSLDRPRRREYVAYSYSYVHRGDYNYLLRQEDLEFVSRDDLDNMVHDPYFGAAVSAWRRKYKNDHAP